MRSKKILFILSTLLLLSLLCSCATNMQASKNDAKPVVAINDAAPQTSEQASPSPAGKLTTDDKKAQSIKIVAVGDILLGRGVGFRLKANGKSFTYPFEKVVNILKEGDIIFGNLEEPITSSTKGLTNIDAGGKYVLKNDVEAFEGIKYAGFNLLNLANNHILDFYEEGLNETINILDKHEIAHAGAGKNLSEARKPAIIERKGIKVGMLSYTDMSEVLYMGNPPLKFIAGEGKAGVAPRYEDYRYLKEDIEALRKEVDIVIVSLHWGIEESFEVTSSQREYAYNLLDCGADIILGHHPHQFQGIEIYKGKPIIYSMGNFIFDQNDPENQETFILNMEFLGNKLVNFSATPTRTIGKTQVVPLEGDNASQLLRRQIDLNAKLGCKSFIKDDKLVFEITEVK